LQKDVLNKLYTKLVGVIPKNVLVKKNKSATWKYGYNEKYDIVVISKTGEIGDIIKMNGINIALPLQPKKITKRHSATKHQYWERHEYPKSLKNFYHISMERPTQYI